MRSLVAPFAFLALALASPGAAAPPNCGNGTCDEGEFWMNCISDCPADCGNGICETEFGEDEGNCAADCSASTCPNGTCDEDPATCPEDCAVPFCNGDGVCDPGEDAEHCPADNCGGGCTPNQTCAGLCGVQDDGCGTPIDCGPCGGGCNANGSCDAGEDSNSCPADCGPVCGNSVCEAGEQGNCADCNAHCTGSSCPADVCGNDICEAGEDCSNCAADCAARPTFTVTPGQPTAGQEAVLMADPSLILDPPTPLWDLGNTDHRSGNPLSYTYSNPGTYTVILTASEANCGKTVTARKGIQVLAGAPANRPPVARPGSGYAGRTFEVVNFDGSLSSDPDGAITAYRWDFGDGVQGDGRVVPHIYVAERNYNVTLTVTDNGGLTDTAFTSANISGSLTNNRFVTSESLRYDSFTNELRASASLFIPAPDSLTFKPQIKYVIHDLAGHRYDSGFVLLDSPVVRIVTNPAGGTWYFEVEYYFADYVHPGVQPFLVARKTVTEFVSPTPVGPRPRIDGPSELWYFNGVQTASPNPTQVTLYALNTSGPCVFSIEQGQGRVTQTSAGGCSATFVSLSRSAFARDVTIRVEAGGQTSDPFYLTVRSPNAVTVLSISDSPRTGGFETEYQLRLLDQFRSSTGGVRLEEQFGTSVNLYPGGNNWGIPQASADTTFFDGGFNDRYFLYFCSDCRPQPVTPFDPASGEAVRDLDQEYLAGPFGAISIKRHTLRWYRGRVRQLQ